MNKIISFGSFTPYLLLSLMSLTACWSIPPANTLSPIKTEVVIEVVGSSSKIIYPSFEELALNSDLVIIGQITEEKEVINTARDPNDPTKPDPEYYSVGQIYDLKVEKYFKGEGPDSINFAQHQSFLVIEDGKQPGGEELQAAKRVENYVQVEFGKPYLLFLREISEYFLEYQEIGLYTGTTEPWIYDYTNPDCVRIEGPDQSLASIFPPQPFAMINEKINAAQDGAIAGETKTYPALSGVNQSLCQIVSGEPYPYP